MSYSLEFTETSQYLHVTFSGNFKPREGETMMLEICDHIIANPQEQVLIEQQPGTHGFLPTLPVLERAAVGLILASIPKPVRIALLTPPRLPKRVLRHIQDVKQVAVERGASVQVCFSKEEAEQWLCS